MDSPLQFEDIKGIAHYDFLIIQDCEDLLEDDRFSATEPYSFSVVFVQVEKFLYELASLYLKADSSSSRTQCQSETLISVVDKLCTGIEGFSKIQQSFLAVELKSRRVLLINI